MDVAAATISDAPGFPRHSTEESVTIPHPASVIVHLERRNAEFLAESDHLRRVRLAEQARTVPATRRRREVLATLAAAMALALVLIVALGAATAAESPLVSPLAAILLPCPV
jgi:hypothetical protein